MDKEQLIKDLRKRLSEYRKSKLYENKVLRQDILSIEIALCLFELATFCERKITKEEFYWFDGGFYIENDITGEWEDLANKYKEMIIIVKEEQLTGLP